MLLGRNNQYCENDYTTECNSTDSMWSLSNYNGIFHRMRTKNFTIQMETQKTQTTKTVLRKKNGAEGINLSDSDYTTKLQSSRQYSAGTKTEI